MGLSIHYSGFFSNTASLSQMIEEVKDIAEARNWQYHIYDTEFPPTNEIGDKPKVYGIIFSAPKCEPVWLTFLADRSMIFGADFALENIEEATPESPRWLFTKTQYAGIEVHKLIIQLFRHLSKKYLVHFKMHDEGQYWETGDEKLLQEIFDRYNAAMDTVVSALETNERTNDETVMDYLMRVFWKLGFRKK